MIAWEVLTVESARTERKKMRLELWLDQENKVVSFWPVPGWQHQAYPSETHLRAQLEHFVSMGFRFQ